MLLSCLFSEKISLANSFVTKKFPVLCGLRISLVIDVSWLPCPVRFIVIERGSSLLPALNPLIEKAEMARSLLSNTRRNTALS
jgi:hypothetical protein